jgi:hypothetical protein
MDEQSWPGGPEKVETFHFSIFETHYRLIGICVCSALSSLRLKARRDRK